MIRATPFPFADPADPLAGATVMQVCPTLAEGSAGRAVLAVAAALAGAGARALVATAGGALVGDLQAVGGVWVPLAANARSPLALWRNARLIEGLIRDEHVDLVHARTRPIALSGLVAVRRTGTPFVTTAEMPGGRLARTGPGRFTSEIARRGDLIVVRSEAVADRLGETWPEAAGRIRVVPASLDMATFSQAAVSLARVEALRRAWGLAPHQRAVLLAGRRVSDAARVLREAMAVLRGQGVGDEIVAVLAGEDGEAAASRPPVTRRDLGDCIRGIGPCQDRPAAFTLAAAVLVPSGADGARIAAEAQAAGTPVVAGEGEEAAALIQAPPEVPAGRRTGWRVLPGDPAALADALREAVALGASARDSLALRARANAERQFSPSAMTQAALLVYAELLAAPR